MTIVFQAYLRIISTTNFFYFLHFVSLWHFEITILLLRCIWSPSVHMWQFQWWRHKMWEVRNWRYNKCAHVVASTHDQFRRFLLSYNNVTKWNNTIREDYKTTQGSVLVHHVRPIFVQKLDSFSSCFVRL